MSAIGAWIGVADYGAFCAAILVFLALPGPGTLALLSATAQAGMRGAVAATGGIIVGDQVLLWMAVAGLSAVMVASPLLFAAVRLAGALYLAWLGWQLWRSRAAAGEGPTMQLKPGHYLRQACLITLLNPKAIVFYLAFFPLFVDPAAHRGIISFAGMAATIAAITAVYGVALCALADRLREPIRRRPGLVLALRRGAGLLLMAFAARLWWT